MKLTGFLKEAAEVFEQEAARQDKLAEEKTAAVYEDNASALSPIFETYEQLTGEKVASDARDEMIRTGVESPAVQMLIKVAAVATKTDDARPAIQMGGAESNDAYDETKVAGVRDSHSIGMPNKPVYTRRGNRREHRELRRAQQK